MRIALLPNRGFVVADAKGLWLRRDERVVSIPVGEFNPYSPLDPLAISPDGRRAWVRGRNGVATRVDLGDGTVEHFDFGLRDAVYGPERTVFAVVEGSTEAAMVEFDDRDPNDQRRIPCPTPRRIHWPYGSPYRYAAYSLDWSGALRLTATRAGLALAHVNGLLWVRFYEGPGRYADEAWMMPPTYQGWTCGYVHEHGVVVTSVHNGRTGDVVWLDRRGIWHDCFDSNWEPLGPCVPARRGFVAGLGDWWVRFEGNPVDICERAFVGARPEDAAVELDGDRVAIGFDDRVALIEGAEQALQVWMADGVDNLELEQLGEPASEPPWRYQAIDDPELGRLWKPDVERARVLAQRLRERANPATTLEALLPGPALESEDDDVDLFELALTRLRRSITPSLSRTKLIRVVERLAADDEPDEFVARSLRDALPPQLREAGRPQAPARAWLLARVPGLFDGRCGDRTIRQATIVADVHARPAWSLLIELDALSSNERERWRVELEDFDPSSLAAPPSELSDEYAVVRGVLFRSERAEPVIVTLDPLAGGFAHRVVVSPPRSGEALLRTGAWFEPPTLERVEQARALTYGADSWPTLYTGLDPDSRLRASPFADDLRQAQLVTRPAPRLDIRGWIDALVADELLELNDSLDDATLWAVEAAVLGLPAERATAALESLLLKHDAVDELFAASEQLLERIVELQT